MRDGIEGMVKEGGGAGFCMVTLGEEQSGDYEKGSSKLCV